MTNRQAYKKAFGVLAEWARLEGQGLVADDLGISISHVSRILSGQRSITPKIARKISQATGVPKEDFLIWD